MASAKVLPAASAASVGRRPTEPVTPLSTTSAPMAAALTTASGPATTSIPGRALANSVKMLGAREGDKLRTERARLGDHSVGLGTAGRESDNVKCLSDGAR